jgi:hypothetical protein
MEKPQSTPSARRGRPPKNTQTSESALSKRILNDRQRVRKEIDGLRSQLRRLEGLCMRLKSAVGALEEAENKRIVESKLPNKKVKRNVLNLFKRS